jgi:hypothetical protein
MTRCSLDVRGHGPTSLRVPARYYRSTSVSTPEYVVLRQLWEIGEVDRLTRIDYFRP